LSWDTDIVTLLSYGQNERLRERVESVEEEEELAVTIITSMEIPQGRLDSIVKAASEEDLLQGDGTISRFRDVASLVPSPGSQRRSCSAFQRDDEAKEEAQDEAPPTCLLPALRWRMRPSCSRGTSMTTSS